MTLYFRSPDAIFSEVEGEFVALNINKGQCYGMDSIASTVWTMIDEPRSIEEICGTLQDIYDVDSETCRSDVESLLTTLSQEGLVGIR
ncbi:MAG TPA: PqqD family protein [Sphingomicrobium sp.]|nr:PqqD family protein [Sphingomicrobium sp.]